MNVPSGKMTFWVKLDSPSSLPPELVGSRFDLASLAPDLHADFDPALIQDARVYARRACSLLR